MITGHALPAQRGEGRAGAKSPASQLPTTPAPCPGPLTHCLTEALPQPGRRRRHPVHRGPPRNPGPHRGPELDAGPLRPWGGAAVSLAPKHQLLDVHNS